MDVEIMDTDETHVGVRVYNNLENEHRLIVSKDGGEIAVHQTETYPHKVEDRTIEDQRIMTQVEARARYAAQKECPEADILHPMWMPEHVEAGLESLGSIELDEFRSEFREFYDAVRDPVSYLRREDIQEDSVVVNKVIRFRDGEVKEYSDLVLHYKTADGEEHSMGSPPSWPLEEQLMLSIPKLEFEEKFDFEEDFHSIIVSHVMAQIRDIYLDMGEEPPEEYNVEGVGKINIIGDETWEERLDPAIKANS